MDPVILRNVNQWTGSRKTLSRRSAQSFLSRGRAARWLLMILLAHSIVFASALSGLAEPPQPKDLIAKAIENFSELDSYQCRMILTIKKGTDTADNEYLYSYQKPNLIRMHVVKGDQRKNTVILRADGKIRGRREGLLSAIPFTLKPDDKRLYDLWGYHFTEAGWGALLKETAADMEAASSCSVETIEGGKQFLVRVNGEDGFLEEVWLEGERLLLVKRRIRHANGDQIVCHWTEIALNAQFDENFFNF